MLLTLDHEVPGSNPVKEGNSAVDCMALHFVVFHYHIIISAQLNA